MIRAFVEISGESPPLAAAEVAGAVEVLGGTVLDDPSGPSPLVSVELPREAVGRLAVRLGLAHRCLVPAPDLRPAGPDAPPPGTAAFRPLGRPSGGGLDPAVREAAERWKAAGGRVDLDRPDHRFWHVLFPDGRRRWLEEVGAVDRKATAARAISTLPYRRPVGLAPRLARAAANLARAAPGRTVVDPFLGTGALLAEAGLLGSRVYGIDQDPTMVRGALQNLEHLGVDAAGVAVGDAGTVDPPNAPPEFDALLTDPPYGRASSTLGEAPAALLARVLPRWAGRLRSGGVAVLIVPAGSAPVLPRCRLETAVEVRVHRSLTREFRVYRREASDRPEPPGAPGRGKAGAPGIPSGAGGSHAAVTGG